MSIIRLFFNPLDGRSEVRYEIEPGTRLIDFLQEHYPTGFKGSLQVFVGNNVLVLSDLDYEVQEFDLVTMLVLPGDPATVIAAWNAIEWGTVLVTALVATAISLAINMLFGPKAPKGLNSNDESPTYSISATRNTARLDQPIASHYGQVSYPPDYAAAPYTFAVDATNDQYVDELLCLGMGEFTINDIFIGDTPINTMEAGTVQYWFFDKTEHLETMGVISSLIGTPNGVPFIENMFTSPEVENFEFKNTSTFVPSTPATATGIAVASTGPGVPGYFVTPDVSPWTGVNIGDTITIAGSASNNGDFQIGSIVTASGNITYYESVWAGYTIANENPLPGTATYSVITEVNQMVGGPFRAQKVGQQINSIDCDIIFPIGLMMIRKDGDRQTLDITMKFTYQQVNETTGAPIGSPISQNKTYSARQTSPLRSTVSSGALTPGAYDVTVERLTAFTSRGQSPETVVWSGLKGHVVNDTSIVAYGPVTIMALRMKATNGLGSAARSRVRVTASRVLESGDPSDNPIVIIKDIFTNSDYGMGRSLAELDITHLDALEASYDSNGVSFNGSFDQRGTGYDAMASTMSLCGATVVQKSALTSVVQDSIINVRSALFSSANIVQGSLTLEYSFDTNGDFDGMQLEYRDPDTFNPLYVTYPVTSVYPDTFKLFGCTDETYAQQMAVYLWNQRTRRRKVAKLSTELEGLIPQFGDRIAISHPLPNWGQSGVLVERISSTIFRLDARITVPAGNVIMFRDKYGVPYGPVAVTEKIKTPGGKPCGVVEAIISTLDDGGSIIELSEVPSISIYVPGDGRDPTNWVIGDSNTMVRDFIVTRTTPNGDVMVNVEGQVYDEAIFIGAPPHMQDDV